MPKHRRQPGAGRPAHPNAHTYIIDLSAYFWDDEAQRVTDKHITISNEIEMLKLVRWFDLGISDPYREKDIVNHYVRSIVSRYTVKALQIFNERGVLMDYEKWLHERE